MPAGRARAMERAASAARDHTAHIEPDPTRAVEIVNVSPTDLPTADSAWTKRMNVTRGDSGQSITAGSYVRNAAGLTIAGTPKGGGLTGSQYMGVAFAAPGDGRTMGVRIQLDSPDFSVLESVYVEFRKDGERVARWRWEPSARMPKSAKPTFLLKDGVKGMYFKQSPTTGSAVEADTVEVFANVAKGASAELTIVRFGWIKN